MLIPSENDLPGRNQEGKENHLPSRFNPTGQDSLFLLQSRPVTALETAWSDEELRAEMDAAVVATKDDVNTKANVG